MVAIRGGPDCGVIVVEVLAHEETRAVCEDDIVFGEAFFGGREGGDDKHSAGAELEEKDWTVIVGKTVQSSV